MVCNDGRSELTPAFCEQDIDLYLQHGFLPYRTVAGDIVFAHDPTRSSCRTWIAQTYGSKAPLIPTNVRNLHAALESEFRAVFQHRAERALAALEPQFSASTVITKGQIAALAAIALAAVLLLPLSPSISGSILTLVLAALSVANIIFRCVLRWVGAKAHPEEVGINTLPDRMLPTYTILVPLFREANMVPPLIRALRKLDYPEDRLDIKLICEADDLETIQAAQRAERFAHFTVVCVPPGKPRTKPRACNYALPFATGEFTVIYDAEDRPEPDQLRKAAARFRHLPNSVACLQARLNFYNANDCWITKMFALDYALWFDYMLDGLDRLRIPMPLGGTSNHFRTDALRAIHGWDPYNVTEDADLGIRFARVGLRVRTLDSTTYEEATNTFGAWTKQRSRWLKGYMQTWLVHMRSPRALLRNAGFRGFVGFQLFIAGTFLSALLNPFLWIVFITTSVHGATSQQAGVLSPHHISLAGIFLSNGIFAYLAMLAPVRRGWFELRPYGLAAPFYWLLISCAAARALWQLFTNPWHWEKTIHGVSRTAEAS